MRDAVGARDVEDRLAGLELEHPAVDGDLRCGRHLRPPPRRCDSSAGSARPRAGRRPADRSLDLVEALDADLRRHDQRAQLLGAAGERDGRLRLGADDLEHGVLEPVLQRRRDRPVLQELVDGARRAAAGGEGRDEAARPGVAVAAAEHARVGRLHGERVDLEGLPLAHLDVARHQLVDAADLADGRDDAVARDHELGPLDRLGATAAGRVGLAQLHAPALEADDLAVLGHDLRRRDQGDHLDALFLGLGDLDRVGRHLRLGAAVEQLDVVEADATGRADAVHGHVAAADDQHRLAGRAASRRRRSRAGTRRRA